MKLFNKIKKYDKIKYYFCALHFATKTKVNDKKIFMILFIPLYKRIIKNGFKKKYILGIRISKKPVNVISSSLDINKNLEKEILRLEGMKILMERENIKLGDKV